MNFSVTNRNYERKEEETVRVMSHWVNMCVFINMLNIKVPSDLNEQYKLNITKYLGFSQSETNYNLS